ncbi:MAG: MauE/DoxX family redox-associated membrane protein [Pseudomonadota bacterium]
MADPAVQLTCALLLSYIFLSAAWHKWRDLETFRETLANYQLLPTALLPIAAVLVPLAELVAGFGLLIPFAYPFAAVIATALMLMYLSAIGINLLRGRRRIDCGCGGPNQKQYLSEWLLLRNVILLLCAALLIWPMVREPLWLDWLTALLAAGIGGLGYHIFN